MWMSISLTNYLLFNIMQQQNKLHSPACEGLSVSAGKSTTEKPSKQRRGYPLCSGNTSMSVSTIISILNGREIVILITLVPCVNLKVWQKKEKKELLFVYSFKKLIENHAQISYSSMTMRSQISKKSCLRGQIYQSS